MSVHLQRSIDIQAPLGFVFEQSNQLDQWPQMIPEYLSVEVIRCEGHKVWFRLTNANEDSWVSWRMFAPPVLAYAERLDPMGPFEFNQITWTYAPTPGGMTIMTWNMFFSLKEEIRVQEQIWAERMAEHVEANQAHMKLWLEARAPVSWSPELLIRAEDHV